MSFSGAVCTCENTENPRHCSEPKTYANKLPLPFSLGEALARRKSYNHFSLLGNYFGGDLNFEAEETKKISASDLIKLVKQIRVASSREGIFKIALGAKVANSIIEASHCPTTLDSVGKAVQFFVCQLAKFCFCSQIVSEINLEISSFSIAILQFSPSPSSEREKFFFIKFFHSVIRRRHYCLTRAGKSSEVEKYEK